MSIQPYLGTNINPTSVDELRYRGLLEEGELLLALFDGVLLDENNRRVGGLALSDFVALTDQRLITWARGLFNDTVDAFVWKDVDVAEAGTWDPFHGRVRLAFRLPTVAPRTRRIALKGGAEGDSVSGDKILINTFDYMPADDVTAMAHMVAWVGDQVLAGLVGEELLAAFGEQFPAPERSAPMPFFSAPPPMAPPPAPPPEAPARKRWWQLGGREEAVQPGLPDSPAGLVAAYESQRSGGAPGRPSDPARPQMPQMPMQGQPIMPEQPSMYDVSRSLRLMLEAPRRIVSGLRRAREAVGGASELVNGMQDPRVRRNALAGMRSAVEQHEEARGPLSPVAPLARAVLAFSEPLESELPPPPAESRRIKVQAAVRSRLGPEPAATPLRPQRSAPAVSPPAPADTPAEVRVGAAVRRSIAVRRSEPEAPVAESQAAPQQPAHVPVDIQPHNGANGRVSPIEPTARPAVRRIVISRSEE